MATIRLSWFIRAGTSNESSNTTSAKDELQLVSAQTDHRLAFNQVEDHNIYLITDGPHSAVSQAVSKPAGAENKIGTLAASRGFVGTGNVTMSASSILEGSTPPLQSPVISIGRFAIEKDSRARFDEEWENIKGILEDFAKPYSTTSGWAESGGLETPTRDEFIMIVGWPSVQRHMEFASTEGFAKYAAIIHGFMKEAEVKHYARLG
ncbi:hypothetical protein S40288_11739 [Stachybotrys chartarum IBT 40288]|nr:hypothetical protein S40288_11739 [Stachybotrys chartarum IBT 40288]